MSYNESETRFYLIDPVLRSKGYDAHWKLKMETPAPVEPTGNRGRRRSGGGEWFARQGLLAIDLHRADKHEPLYAGRGGLTRTVLVDSGEENLDTRSENKGFPVMKS